MSKDGLGERGIAGRLLRKEVVVAEYPLRGSTTTVVVVLCSMGAYDKGE